MKKMITGVFSAALLLTTLAASAKSMLPEFQLPMSKANAGAKHAFAESTAVGNQPYTVECILPKADTHGGEFAPKGTILLTVRGITINRRLFAADAAQAQKIDIVGVMPFYDTDGDNYEIAVRAQSSADFNGWGNGVETVDCMVLK